MTTIGVEIEMAGITRRRAAEVAAKYFGELYAEDTAPDTRYQAWAGRCQDTARDNGYYTWSAWDGQGREWKFSRDSSIHANSEEEKCELITPILTEADIPVLQELVRKIRKAGGVSNADYGCGVHIHIGADGHNAKTLRNLINIMASHEELIIQSLGISEDRLETYCRRVDRDFLARLNRNKPATMSALADEWYARVWGNRNAHYNNSRYRMLNLHSVFTKGTVEFRFFEFEKPGNGRKNGLHADRLKAYIQFAMALNAAALRARSASHRAVQLENPRYAMRTWLLRLGFIGDEYATARKVFTKNLAGDTAWRDNRRVAMA